MSISADVDRLDVGIDPRLQQRRMRRIALLSILAVAAVALGLWGLRWYQSYRWIESTDDAFLSADGVRVAPRVSGYVAEVYTKDTAPVRAGQVLFTIESADLANTLAMQEAELLRAKADLVANDAKSASQIAAIAQANANLRADQSSVDFMRSESKRYDNLAAQGVATKQRAESARSDVERASAAIARDMATINAAKADLTALAADHKAAEGNIKRVEAMLAQAKLDLSRTEIRAPEDGVVGDFAVRPGQYAAAGTSLLTIVPLKKVYLTANFKETQVARMVLGTPVTINLDAFPGITLTGRIDGFSPGTGTEFSLLPPENATGNFTKVVQRVPVRIQLDPDARVSGRLRPGLSAEVSIDTRNRG